MTYVILGYRTNAIEDLLNHSFTKTLIKYLIILQKTNNLALKQLSKILKIRADSVRATLKKKQYLKFIKINDKGIRGNPFTFSITKERRYFIRIFDLMEDLTMEEKLPFEKIEREIIVKREAETDKRYGKKPEERTIKELLDYGVINLNKPGGPTSHQVSDYIQRILGIKKAGHSGTLEEKSGKSCCDRCIADSTWKINKSSANTAEIRKRIYLLNAPA